MRSEPRSSTSEGRSSDPSSTHPGSRRGQIHGHRVRVPAGGHMSVIKRAHPCARCVAPVCPPAGDRDYVPPADTHEAGEKGLTPAGALKNWPAHCTCGRWYGHTMCAHNASTQCEHTMCAHNVRTRGRASPLRHRQVGGQGRNPAGWGENRIERRGGRSRPPRRSVPPRTPPHHERRARSEVLDDPPRFRPKNRTPKKARLAVIKR